MEVDLDDGKVIQFAMVKSEAKVIPIFERAPYSLNRCRHNDGTFLVDTTENRVTCSSCNEVIEAIEVIKKMLDREWARGRRDNAERGRVSQEWVAYHTRGEAGFKHNASVWEATVNFTIYRDSWRRGGDVPELNEKFGDTVLFNPSHPTNNMCCLGQVCAGDGIPLADLAGVGEPSEVSHVHLAQMLDIGLMIEDGRRQSKLVDKAIDINDDIMIDDQKREASLIKVFAKSGHTLTFVDGKAPWLEAVA